MKISDQDNKDHACCLLTLNEKAIPLYKHPFILTYLMLFLCVRCSFIIKYNKYDKIQVRSRIAFSQMTYTSSNTILVRDSNDNDPISGRFSGVPLWLRRGQSVLLLSMSRVCHFFKYLFLISVGKANKAFNDLRHQRFMSFVIKSMIQIKTRTRGLYYTHLTSDTSSIKLIYTYSV